MATERLKRDLSHAIEATVITVFEGTSRWTKRYPTAAVAIAEAKAIGLLGSSRHLLRTTAGVTTAKVHYSFSPPSDFVVGKLITNGFHRMPLD